MANHIFPGCVIGIVSAKWDRLILPFGRFTYENDSKCVETHTVYDLASITKSIPTASLALRLIDEWRLNLTDKLIDYIPEFRNSDRENVLIKHLLTYTIHGYGLASMKGLNGQQLMETLLTRDFEKRPGTSFAYTNIPAAFLWLVIEKMYGETLDILARKYFFEPLEMNKTVFNIREEDRHMIPPTEVDFRWLVQWIVHDESAHIWRHEGKIVGHAGLFSCAPDLLNFMEMLLKGWAVWGERFFSEEIIRQIETNQISDIGESTWLWWELNQPRYMSSACTSQTFGKTGFTGTLAACDRGLGLAYVILSNRTFPTRTKDSSAINAFRSDIGGIILSS